MLDSSSTTTTTAMMLFHFCTLSLFFLPFFAFTSFHYYSLITIHSRMRMHDTHFHTCTHAQSLPFYLLPPSTLHFALTRVWSVAGIFLICVCTIPSRLLISHSPTHAHTHTSYAHVRTHTHTHTYTRHITHTHTYTHTHVSHPHLTTSGFRFCPAPLSLFGPSPLRKTV